MKLKSIYRENIYNIDEVTKLRNFIEEENNDFEFNQDIEFNNEVKSPGWIRYQKKLK